MSMSYDELKNKVLDRYGHIDSIPDSVYNAMKEYQKNGNAALDDDRVFNILKSEKEYSPVIESKEVSNDSIISKSPSLFETLMPRATSQTEKSPIQTLWSGAKDISSLPGRAVAEGVGLLGDVAGTITGSLNMPKEYRREYLDEELGNLVSTSPERISNINDDQNYGRIYNLAKGIVTDPLAPAYLAIGGANPATANMAAKLGMAGARAIGTAALPITDIAISESRLPTKMETATSLLAGIAPELFNIKGLRSEVAKEQLKNAETLVETAKKRLRSAEQSGEAVRTMRAEDINPSEPIDISLTPREQSARDFLETKRKEAIKSAEKVRTLENPLSKGDVIVGTIGYAVGGPIGAAVGATTPRGFFNPSVGKLGQPALRMIIDSGIEQYNRGKISRADLTALTNAAESIRINPSDSSATKIIQEYHNRFMK